MTEFWKKWLKATEVERHKLIMDLNLQDLNSVESKSLLISYFEDLEEQARLEGIEQGRQLERETWETLFKDTIDIDNISDAEVLEKIIMEKARREVLDEIEPIRDSVSEHFLLEHNSEKKEYVVFKKEDFEALKKKGLK